MFFVKYIFVLLSRILILQTVYIALLQISGGPWMKTRNGKEIMIGKQETNGAERLMALV